MELIDANPATLKAYGIVSIDDVKGKRYSDLYDQELLTIVLENMKKMKNWGNLSRKKPTSMLMVETILRPRSFYPMISSSLLV